MNNQELKAQIRKEFRKFRKSGYNSENWNAYLDHSRKLFKNAVFNHLVNEVLNDFDKVETRLKAYKQSSRFRFKIRGFCNRYGYSDIDPNEVVQVISPTKVLIRKMDARLVQKPVQHVGGFCANTENDTQKWECVSNHENDTQIITLTKKGWNGGNFIMSDRAIKFYDYNF